VEAKTAVCHRSRKKQKKGLRRKKKGREKKLEAELTKDFRKA